MPIVGIPSLLRSFTAGKDRIAVPGATIGEVIDHLEGTFPGIKARLCDADGLRRGLAVAVDTQLARLGLDQPVDENSEIHFIPAIGGGS
jgi:sulfur-carrier protein